MKTLVLFKIILLSMNMTFASGDHAAPKNVELKKGGAVSAFSEEDGFKLSDRAVNNLGVSYTSVKGKGPWTIPKSALVRIKHSTGVYRKWDGWNTMVLVKVVDQGKKTVTIQSVDLQDQDEVAVTGVPFLRMTDADLNSETVDSCAH